MRRALPLGHAAFGRVQPCPCAAEEGEQQRQGRLQRYSNLGPLTRLTFDALDPARSAPFAAATDAARAFAREARGWLVLWGASGSGKTALAAAMANERIARGAPALYVVVPDLLDHLRAAYGSDAEIPFPRLFQQVRDAPFLILDDLDAGNPTAWAQEKFFQLINHRFNGQLPTVLLTLTPPRKLPERLCSRLDGPDLVRTLCLDADAGGAYKQIGGMTRARLERFSFDRFHPEADGATEAEARNLARALETARQWSRRPKGWLTFTGGNGCGKTHLAGAIVRERLAAGDSVSFAVVPDLLDHLRASFNPQSPTTYDELFDEIRAAPLLLLDDLGAHSTSPWAEEKLYQIFSYRYIQALPTLVTTNLNPEDLPARLASRLLDPDQAVFFVVDAPDYRARTRPRAQPHPAAAPAARRTGGRRRHRE